MAQRDTVPQYNGFRFPVLEGNGQGAAQCVLVCQGSLARGRRLLPGLRSKKGKRFGLHNLRHSLSNWLVNKAKENPKTVQGILRHEKIETTMNLYTQDDHDEKLAAQGKYLEALGVESKGVQ